MGWLEDNYYPAGFSISDCKERNLVAGLYTDLVRGTKTEKDKGGRKWGMRLHKCQKQ